jgi:uncharacterized protein (TIGR03437 family)
MRCFLTASFVSILAASLPAQAQPTVFDGGVINGASYIPGQPVAPGGIVAIYGSNLSTDTVPGDTVPLSAMINNTSVTFNGIPAPLLFVSGGQVNAQMPWEALPADATTGAVNVVVTNNGVSSAPAAVPLTQIAPGIFSIPNGEGYAVAVNNKDGSLAAPVGALPGINTHPADAGDAIILYANGLGPVDVPNADGADSMDALRHTTTTPVVLLGGTEAEVFFSGLTPQFPGVNQINFFVPKVTPGDSIPLQLKAGGITSTDKVVMAVE